MTLVPLRLLDPRKKMKTTTITLVAVLFILRPAARADDALWLPSMRYASAGYPEATLYNKEGLPARPFRYPAVELKEIQKECQPAK